MIEYRNFKYQLKRENTWYVRYPSGFKTFIEASSETALKQKLDTLISIFES